MVPSAGKSHPIGNMPVPQADESDSESSDSSSKDETEIEDDDKSGEAKDSEMNHAEYKEEEGVAGEKDRDEGAELSEYVFDVRCC